MQAVLCTRNQTQWKIKPQSCLLSLHLWPLRIIKARTLLYRLIHAFRLRWGCLRSKFKSNEGSICSKASLGLQTWAEQLICEAEPHAKQLSPLSWAHTKDEEDAHKHMVCAHKSGTQSHTRAPTHTQARTHTCTQSMAGNQRGYSLWWKEPSLNCSKTQAGKQPASVCACMCVCCVCAWEW